jgi:hypothetical protein
VSPDSGNLSFLAGAGDGTFGEAVPYPAAGGAVSVALAHLDGNTDLDAAVAATDVNAVAVLLSQGAGALAAPVSAPAPPRSPRPISTATATPTWRSPTAARMTSPSC